MKPREENSIQKRAKILLESSKNGGQEYFILGGRGLHFGAFSGVRGLPGASLHPGGFLEAARILNPSWGTFLSFLGPSRGPPGPLLRASRGPPGLSRRPQMAPRGPQDGPRWPQEGLLGASWGLLGDKRRHSIWRVVKCCILNAFYSRKSSKNVGILFVNN